MKVWKKFQTFFFCGKIGTPAFGLIKKREAWRDPVHENHLSLYLKTLPATPGVYIFKDAKETILYVGKAKSLKHRVSSYFQKNVTWKTASLIAHATKIDHIKTNTELEALLLEAELIQGSKPKFNVLLKDGQPFIYFVVTNNVLPTIELARNKSLKGTYFGPFIERGHARRVHNFLIKTFALRLCNKKMANGCLYFHMGLCAGSCKEDFDFEGYKKRVNLAKKLLTKGHAKFLEYLLEQIAEHNKNLAFEKSRELHNYYLAFEHVFSTLESDLFSTAFSKDIFYKDMWILTKDKKALYLIREKHGALKKEKAFILGHEEMLEHEDLVEQYFLSYYRGHESPNTILTNFDFENREVLEKFLQEWHKKPVPVSITKPAAGHHASLVTMGKLHADYEEAKKLEAPKVLKRLLELSKEPHSIDCFDISHKQGNWMVGSCVRFVDGAPEKEAFRRFKIKTVQHQNDYACLREIVQRRYAHDKDFPDLILIDGGKGQLHAVQDLYPQIDFVSLAKREETVFSDKFPEGKILDKKSISGQLLIALRDYAHHFAITYHRSLANKFDPEDNE